MRRLRNISLYFILMASVVLVVGIQVRGVRAMKRDQDRGKNITGHLRVNNRSQVKIYPKLYVPHEESFGVIRAGGGAEIGFAILGRETRIRASWSEHSWTNPASHVEFALTMPPSMTNKTSKLIFTYEGDQLWKLNVIEMDGYYDGPVRLCVTGTSVTVTSGGEAVVLKREEPDHTREAHECTNTPAR